MGSRGTSPARADLDHLPLTDGFLSGKISPSRDMRSQAEHIDSGEHQPDNRRALVILPLRKPRRRRGDAGMRAGAREHDAARPRAAAPADRQPHRRVLCAHCLASALAVLLPRWRAAAAAAPRWTGIAALSRHREGTPRAAVATGVAAASSHVGSMDDHRRQGAAHASRVAACETLTGRGAVKIASILIVTNEGR